MMLIIMTDFEEAVGARAARAIRRADKEMPDERARDTLARGHAGRGGTVGRLTGKETPLPAPEHRWPRADHTKTPHARP